MEQNALRFKIGEFETDSLLAAILYQKNEIDRQEYYQNAGKEEACLKWK